MFAAPLNRWVLLCAASVAIAGCGKAPNTYPLAGKVTLDGQPLANGILAFVPLEKGAGVRPITIVDGAFSCTPENGPSAGKYRIEISAYESTGRKVPDSDIPGKMVGESQQIVPARYNRHSKLTLEIPSADAEALDFALKRT